jgi:lipopolysaccharide export LptBFGC system permease protein LptF
MVLETDVSPFDIVRAAEDEELSSLFQTLGRLRQRMQADPDTPSLAVQFHSRLASFFGPLVLLLVGLPLLVGFEHSVTSRMLGIVISIAVAVGYYAMTFVFGNMGNTAVLDPLLAGWLPTIVTGSVGLVLFEWLLM